MDGTWFETKLSSRYFLRLSVLALAMLCAPGIATPSVFAQSLGCTNPYLAPDTTDWGSPPAYQDSNVDGPITKKLKSAGYVDPLTEFAVGAETVALPTYSRNHIFWISRENGPGQSVLLSGAFTTNSKNVLLAPIPAGTTNITTLLNGATDQVTPTSMGSTWLTFQIPSTFSAGPVAFRIVDSVAGNLDSAANVPEIRWAMGVVTVASGNAKVFAHTVIPCGVEQGGTLRIFGKNFLSGQAVVIQNSSGMNQLTITHSDENSISVQIPSSLAPGSYSVWVGNATEDDAASSPAVPIQIVAAAAPTVTAITCNSLNANGTKDDSTLLQNCLNSNTPANPSTNQTVIKLPAGTFLIKEQIRLNPGEYIQGAGSTSTTILGSNSSPPTSWFIGSQQFGLANLTVEAPMAESGAIIQTDDLNGSGPSTSGYVTLNGVIMSATTAPSDGTAVAIHLTGPSIQVLNSTVSMNNNAGEDLDVTYSSGDWINNYTANQGSGGLDVAGMDQYVIMENSTVSGPAPSTGLVGGTVFFSLTSSQYSYYGGGGTRSDQVQRYQYLGHNHLLNMTMPGVIAEQAFATDGGGQAYFGTIASSTASSVTLLHSPDWSFTGNTIPDSLAVQIIAGTGVGQYRHMASYSGLTINLTQAWTVRPDSTSVIVISHIRKDLIVAHNTFQNIASDAILAFGLWFDDVIESNTVIDGGDGIRVCSYGPYQDEFYYQTMNVDVLNNSTSAGPLDNLILYGGITLQEMPGTTEAGIIVRGNTLPPDPAYDQEVWPSNRFLGWFNVLAEQNTENYTADDILGLQQDGPVFSADPSFLIQGINY